MCWISADHWCSHSHPISKRSNPIFLAVAVGSGPPWQSKGLYVLCQSLLYAQIFLDARFGSEVATFQHWGLLKDVCRFRLSCSLHVYPAHDGRLLQQTHISRSVRGEQVPAFLKINLLFWSGGVIGTERLPARIYNVQSEGAKWAALAQFGWTRNRLLGAWPFSPSLNLDSPVPACISPWC